MVLSGILFVVTKTGGRLHCGLEEENSNSQEQPGLVQVLNSLDQGNSRLSKPTQTPIHL